MHSFHVCLVESNQRPNSKVLFVCLTWFVEDWVQDILGYYTKSLPLPSTKSWIHSSRHIQNIFAVSLSKLAQILISISIWTVLLNWNAFEPAKSSVNSAKEIFKSSLPFIRQVQCTCRRQHKFVWPCHTDNPQFTCGLSQYLSRLNKSIYLHKIVIQRPSSHFFTRKLLLTTCIRQFYMVIRKQMWHGFSLTVE